MKLKAFRIYNFRCINDSGWVDVSDLTTIVGQNEVGKSALISALHRLNPIHDQKYSITHDWPRSKRASANQDAIMLQAKFVLNSSQINKLSDEYDMTLPDKFVYANQNYKGEITVKTSDSSDSHTVDESALKQQILKLYQPIGDVSEFFITALDTLSEQAQDLIGVVERLNSPNIQKLIEQAELLREKAMYGKDFETHNRLVTGLIKANSMIQSSERDFPPEAEKLIMSWMPKFHYIDSTFHRSFSGMIDLEQLKKRADSGKYTLQDWQWMMLLNLAGLELGDQSAKFNQNEPDQRLFDFSDASTRLSKTFQKHWGGREYELQLIPKGSEIIFFVNKKDATDTIRFDEHSDGYRHFFLIDLTMTYYLKNHTNLVFLMDEPSLYLHSKTQTELTKLIGEYSKYCQVVYATQSHFMLPMAILGNVRVAIYDGKKGTRVFNYDEDLVENEPAAESAISIIGGITTTKPQKRRLAPVGCPIIYVESLADMWIISGMVSLLRTGEFETLNDTILIVPVKDRKAPLPTEEYTLSLLSDPEQLSNEDNFGAKSITYGEIVEKPGVVMIEDLLSQDFYLNFLNSSHAQEMGYQRLGLSKLGEFAHIGNINKQAEAAVAKLSGNSNFTIDRNKYARKVLHELSKISFELVPNDTVRNFLALFTKINALFTEDT